MLFQLHYFKKTEHICSDDFNSKNQIETINLNHLLSLSDLLTFDLPFSGKFVGKYALVTMVNNDKYYIKEESFSELSNALAKIINQPPSKKTVKFKHYKYGKWIEGSGIFHQFGFDSIESNEGNTTFSTAIIETDTGLIYNVPVEYVSFIGAVSN